MQAEIRAHLRELLAVEVGVVVLTTIQKFFPHEKGDRHPTLSERRNVVVGYLWARTAPCSNPSCRGESPLLRSLLVCNKSDKKVALTMGVDKDHKTVRFGIAKGKGIQRTKGTKREPARRAVPSARVQPRRANRPSTS